MFTKMPIFHFQQNTTMSLFRIIGGKRVYAPKPDKYKHKKPKSNNPWSRNYDDSVRGEDTTLSQPQDYSQGYQNPYVHTPAPPVFDRPSVQDGEANLRSFMADSNKPPHLQNRWKKQPSKPDFSQLSDREKCCCEPKGEGFEADLENMGKVEYRYGKAYHEEKPIWNKAKQPWEKSAWEARKDGDRQIGIKNPFKKLQEDIKYAFYTYDGEFLGSTGKSNNAIIYVIHKDKFPNDVSKNASIVYRGAYDTFLRIAGLAYSESGLSNEVIEALPFVIVNRHNQLITSKHPKYNANLKGNTKEWTLQDTLFNARNSWTDEKYASVNSAFSAFIGEGKKASPVNLEANALNRNENKQMCIAFKATIQSMQYMEGAPFADLANGAIGWHGDDILTNTAWLGWLCIRKEHLLYGFEKWKGKTFDKNTLVAGDPDEKGITTNFISTQVFKGATGYGPTLFFKSTIYAKKNHPTGQL